MWTVIMTIITIIAFIILLAFLQRGLIPANQSEKVAIGAISEMKKNTSKYLDEQSFSKKQKTLQKEGVYLSAYLLNGEMTSGPEIFNLLLKKKSITSLLNNNIRSEEYFNQFVHIIVHGIITEIWAYSYNLKTGFIYMYYSLVIVVMTFLLFLSPIVYFVIFSRLYINKLYKSIKHPIDELMKASYKIRQKDLEFSLNYSSNNEIGKLTNSF